MSNKVKMTNIEQNNLREEFWNRLTDISDLEEVDDIQVSYGENISVTTQPNLKEITITEALNIIKSDKLKVHTDFLRNEQDKKIKSAYKVKHLPFVTFNGLFSPRNKNGLQKASGLMIMDYDETYNDDESLRIRKILENDKHVYSVFTSPSGALKFIVRIPAVENDDMFKQHYEGVREHFNKKGVILDISGKDVCRVCFLSHDSSIYVNENAETLHDKVILKENTQQSLKILKNQHKTSNNVKIPQKCELIESFFCKEYSESANGVTKHANVDPHVYNYCVTNKKHMLMDYYMHLHKRGPGSFNNSGTVEFNCGAMVNYIKKTGHKQQQKHCNGCEKQKEYIKKNNFQFLDIVELSPEKRAIEIVNKNPLWFDREKKWWGFDKEKKQWKQIDEIDIVTYVKKCYKLHGLSSSSQRSTLLNAIRDEARFREPKELSNYQIQIGKFIYDIRNDNVIEASPKILPNIIIDKNIDEISEDEECTHIDKLFNDWLGDDKQVLYDIIAFIMSPKYFLDICFWLTGTGENGKGLYQTIVHNVIGHNNSTSQDLEILSDPKDRFTKGFLRNKLLCSLGDGNSQVITHTKAIKTLSGGTDLVRGEIKGAGQVDFYNRAKLLGAYNTLPETNDKSNGFYRRQHITEFKNKFSGLKNPLPNVPEREYTILAKKCFSRLKEIYKENMISGWGSVDERREKYDRLSNPVGLFIKNNMKQTYDGCVFSRTIYKHYKAFSIKNGYIDLKLEDFEARLLNQGYVKKKKYVYMYDGCCWGRKSKIPDFIDENDVEYNKRTVFLGLDFQNYSFLDLLDPLEPLFQIESSRKKHQHQKQGPKGPKGPKTNLSVTRILTGDTSIKKASSIIKKSAILEKIQSYGSEGVNIESIISYYGEDFRLTIDKFIEKSKFDGEIIEISPGKVSIM